MCSPKATQPDREGFAPALGSCEWPTRWEAVGLSRGAWGRGMPGEMAELVGAFEPVRGEVGGL